MGRRDSARRLQLAIVDLQRITNSRRLHGIRSERSGVSLSPAAGGVLRHVVDGGPIRPGALADRARMQPPALTRQLKSLEADGCIERVAAPSDRRGALVRATRRGRSLVHQLEAGADHNIRAQPAAWATARPAPP